MRVDDGIIMHSKHEICKRMHIGNERFFEWIANGAPIACELVRGKPDYSADIRALQSWRSSFYTYEKFLTKRETKKKP